MTLRWNKDDMVVLGETEADLDALATAGYTAILPPDGDDFGPIPRASHYVVAANGNGREIAAGLVKAGVCRDWQVSVCFTKGYPDLSHAMEEGGQGLIDHRAVG